MRRIAIYLLCIFMLLPVATMTAQPGYNYSKLQREKLNRGVVAIRENPSEVIVSWRYLSSDPIQTGFNVYRDGKKLTDTPITVSTWFFVKFGGKFFSAHLANSVSAYIFL